MRIGRIATKTVTVETSENLSQTASIFHRHPALDAGLGFSFATLCSEFCENSSRPYFLRALRVKETMPGSREVREGKKSVKGLRYTIGEKLEEAQPRVPGLRRGRRARGDGALTYFTTILSAVLQLGVYDKYYR